jgi:multidrug efflux system membrane fusion protein
MQAIRGGRQPEVDAYDRAAVKKLATGKVESFNSQIDNTTGTLRLRATFNNDDAVLFPNQFVNVRLLVEEKRGVTLVMVTHNLRLAELTDRIIHIAGGRLAS